MNTLEKLLIVVLTLGIIALFLAIVSLTKLLFS